MIEFRPVSVDDPLPLADIDRSEHIDGEYRMHDGALSLAPMSLDTHGWNDTDVTRYTTRLRSVLVAGGPVIAAWDGDRLIGFASVDVLGVGGDRSVLQLDMLYVSRESRGRGIGRTLTQQIVGLARAHGAKSLYVSATPTRATVDAYIRMEARLVAEPDPTLFERYGVRTLSAPLVTFGPPLRPRS